MILDCLAKKRDQRPQSAREVIRLLAAIETDPWGEEQASHWWASHVIQQDDGPTTFFAFDPGDSERAIVTAVK